MTNRNRLLYATAIALVALLSTVGLWIFTHFNAPKIAYVDAAILLEKYDGMIAARASFQQKATQWQANMDTLNKEFQVLLTDFEQDNGQMTEKERTRSQKLIKDKRKQLANYQQAIQQQSQQEDQRMTEKVLSEINTVLASYAKSVGYDLVLGASGNGNIVYGVEAMNITEDVLEHLNHSYHGIH
ncbi:MAG: OmpH family outer membrane protein [Bacteroidota bacterium]